MTTKNFKAQAVRTIASPSNPEITTYYTWVEFKDLPSDFSLEVNPRKPKMTTSVAKQLIAAVVSPDVVEFDINNRGIVITAKSFKFNPSTNMITLDLDNDTNNYGILDGGHTYTAITQNRDKVPEGIEKFVRLEIIVGENLDITALADARNTSAQVSDIALFELDDKFDVIKDAIKDQPYENRVAYKDNDNKDIPIANLLKLMFMFNIERYPDDSNAPVPAYSAKAAVFRDYKKQLDTGNSIYKPLSKHLPLLVELYEKIQQEIPELYNEFKEKEEGKKGKFGGVRGVGKTGKYHTDFSDKEMSYQVPSGFLLPIFGAFRALLKYKNGAIEWEFNPIEMWEKAGIRLVQNTFDTDTNPQQAGKNKTLWQANYRIVDSLRKDLLLEKLMSQQG